MSGTLADLLLQATDPLTAAMLLALAAYCRQQFGAIQRRVRRLEATYITDGGREVDDGG